VPTPRPTIVDVARHAGVSKGLVSLALNDRPGVSPETRRRILASADLLEWRPSRPARQLSLKTAFALGLVLRRDPHVIAADSFFPHFIAGIESLLANAGRSLLLSVVGDEAAEHAAYTRLAAERRVDGLFLTDLRVHDRRFELLRRLAVPTVLVGQPSEPAPWPAVTVDDRAGITAAVRRLAAAGHVRIAHVTGDPDMVHGLSRRHAFVAAMTDLGLDPTLVEIADFSAASGAAATEALLCRDPRPTAVVYANDPMAIAGLGVLTAGGVRVPDDVSITGFDGSEVGAYLHPALSTVTTNPYGWGARAARTLLDLHEHGAADDVALPPASFIPRGSIGPVPSPTVPSKE